MHELHTFWRIWHIFKAKINDGSRFRKNFLKAASANLLAQSIAIICTPILTRLYIPADFATFAAFVAILDFLLSLSTLRFEWLLPNCKTTKLAGTILVLAVISLLVTCSIYIVLIATGIVDALGIKGWQSITAYAWLLPIVLLGSGFQQILQGWFIRQAQLGIVSKAKIIQSSTFVICSLFFGVVLPGVCGLIIAQTFGQWAAAGTMIRRSRKNIVAAVKPVELLALRVGMRRYGNQAMISTASSVVSVLGMTIPTLLIAQHFSVTELGWYALVQRCITAPAALIANSLGQSFWAEAAILVVNDKDALKQLYIRTTSKLVLIVLPLAIILLAGPWYIGPIFGVEHWNGAGYVLSALTPMFIGLIVVAPLNHLIVHGKQHWQLYVDIFRLTCIGLLFLCADVVDMRFIPFVCIIAFIYLLSHCLIFILHIIILNKHLPFRAEMES